MKVLIVGGGPAGLYAGLLLKKADPSRQIRIVERNPRGATYGWGVVFSDRTLNAFREVDLPTYEAITDAFVLWDAIDIHFRGEVMRCGGNVFAGMARRALLDILSRRCEELSIPITYESEVTDTADFRQYDLVIAADGINSLIRTEFAEHFKPGLEPGKARYIWFGTHRVFDSFTFSIKPNEYGLFQAHAYPFDTDTGTFIVECDEESWRRAGLSEADEAASIALCEQMFADDLRGHALLSNNSKWIGFVTVRNRRWHHENVVLLGDAAHTAHFSIGSGTKLAMEDAIALARAFDTYGTVEEALINYELDRKPRVTALQDAARESQDYFETLKRFAHLEPEQFAFHLLTRSGRLNYDNLKIRDARYVERVERWFWRDATHAPALIAPPPLFVPLTLRGVALHNRAAMAAIPPDTAQDGVPGEDFAEQLVRRAQAGAALVISGPVAASAGGRITPGTAGLYADEQRDAWARIAERIRRESEAKIALHLIHAGRRGATRPRAGGLDRPLADGGWPLLAPSPLPYTPASAVPKAMDAGDMEQVCEAFVSAARRARDAGFDLLHLDLGHGYLLGSFLSPLTNQRDDAYGGSLENRLRFPMQVFDAVREAWPEDRPVSAAINASDWARGGIGEEDALAIAAALKAHGCDLLRPVAGQTVPSAAPPSYGPDFLIAYSERIRNEVRIPTLASGGITGTNAANSILAGGRADLCLLDLPDLRE